ncbi:hypothetical protein [Wolinella succinogenes]|uniref:hypothetical protein n=1 Tax=Wolinella succinogenes TaxID=844 RepID=UPI00240A084F|nr:hypothetical protein [Wolinella succinogenes]
MIIVPTSLIHSKGSINKLFSIKNKEYVNLPAKEHHRELQRCHRLVSEHEWLQNFTSAYDIDLDEIGYLRQMDEQKLEEVSYRESPLLYVIFNSEIDKILQIILSPNIEHRPCEPFHSKKPPKDLLILMQEEILSLPSLDEEVQKAAHAFEVESIDMADLREKRKDNILKIFGIYLSFLLHQELRILRQNVYLHYITVFDTQESQLPYPAHSDDLRLIEEFLEEKECTKESYYRRTLIPLTLQEEIGAIVITATPFENDKVLFKNIRLMSQFVLLALSK